ncbi:bacterial proteasome activator family protein [Ruania halotolerans]|uniref:bacterial proteasome activator family protein n=1 Tax=Ruania halotolerans TaxID=2897773 RepID=UPI001E41021F|nr:bacterial proteasome activator family protein [Ruania halotolerans]UFU06958.1 bacterial proteasome activator family protein [Ruania halotolerans]
MTSTDREDTTDEPAGSTAEGPRDDSTAAQDRSEGSGESSEGPRVVVSSQDGLGVATDDDSDPSTLVAEPAKVMRIGTMIKQLLDEVRGAPLDDAARERMAAIHEKSLHELEDGLSEDLVAELHRITLPFSDDRTPSDAELRIAQAQLVGWLEGLFHGIQTALVAQQMAAKNQLVQMRKALPPGVNPGQSLGLGEQDGGEHHGTGQYL